MDITKIVAYMNTYMYGNPLEDEAIKTIHHRIEDKKSIVGKVIRILLEKAEEGEFK